jgi:hypothetical protein
VEKLGDKLLFSITQKNVNYNRRQLLTISKPMEGKENWFKGSVVTCHSIKIFFASPPPTQQIINLFINPICYSLRLSLVFTG